MAQSHNIHVPPGFGEYVAPAIVRLTYLYPEFEFIHTASEIEVKGDFVEISRNTMNREVHHQLYRERIYSETLPIRKSLFSSE